MAKTPRTLLYQLGSAPVAVAAVHGHYPSWYERAWGGELTAWDGRALSGTPPNPRDFAAIVVSGSPASLTSPEPWMDDAADFVRRAHEAGTPTLGVCFGHQLIAHAFGGRVVRNPRGWEIGSWHVDIHAEGANDPIFTGLPTRIRVNFTHQDMVDPRSLAGPLRNLARSERCEVQVLAVDEHVRGVQFHPEITGAVCRAYIADRRALFEKEQDPEALLAATDDCEDGVTVIRNFRRHFVAA